MRRKQIAQETITILEQGSYLAGGKTIPLTEIIQACIKDTICYAPEALADLEEIVSTRPVRFDSTDYETTNESSLQAAERMARSGQFQRIGVLNFASAKNPGGGFTSGAQAQEESLARSSALYSSLQQCLAFYEYHRSLSTCLYSDRMIYSPQCPVFRRDDGTLLEAPYLVDFLSSPAPNAGAVRRNEPENVSAIETVLQERSAKVLALGASHNCEALVLGAWGCGVFQNDPAMVANAFYKHLNSQGAFYGQFRKVLFAVLDNSPAQNTFNVFADRFK